MRLHDLEHWALSVADRVRSAAPVEDSRVELKREWPTEHARAARRLAGHCNASRGDPVLWIIGIDEKSRTITGASSEQTQDWLASVRACFEGVSPTLVRDLVVPIGDRFVVALLFETDRAPYVVKNSEFGKRVGVSIASEVPWREGTAVRSARREDLIRILVPALRTPEVSILSCFVDCRFRKNAFSWECRAELYIVPATRERLVIPHHLCNVFAAIAPFETVTFETEFRLRPSPISVGRRMMKIGHQEVEPLPDGQPSKTIYSSVTETIIDGPGLAILEGHGRSAPIGDGIAGQGTFGAELPLARSDRRVRLDERIRRIRTDENGMRWALESDTAIAEPTPSP